MRTKLKTDKGVAGLTVLLSVVTMLFVVGLLVMIFSLMGGELRDATFTSTAVTVTNETGAWINATTYVVDGSSTHSNGFGDLVITALYNATDNSTIATANVTVSGTGFTNASVTNWADVMVSYSYTYDAENTATEVMNDTTAGVSGVTDWFDIFVVITAMVVLILLTVIIITAIRGSGLMSSGSA